MKAPIDTTQRPGCREQRHCSGRWMKTGRLWIWAPWATLGMIEWTERGYRVVNYYPTGNFCMGMQKYARRTVWRKSLVDAKKAFLARCPNDQTEATAGASPEYSTVNQKS